MYTRLQKAATNYLQRRETWSAAERKATPLTFSALYECEELADVVEQYGLSKAQLVNEVLKSK